MRAAATLRDAGRLADSERVLRDALGSSTASLDAAERRVAAFEAERLSRIRQDYGVTRDKLLQQLQKRVAGFDPTELDRYDPVPDSAMIDGQRRYFNAAASNLLLRVPALAARRAKPAPNAGALRKLHDALRAARAEHASGNHGGLLLPQDMEVTYTLTVARDAAPAGKVVRAWLPFARSFPFQSDIRLLDAEPRPKIIAPPDAPHRTVYLEKPAVAGEPTTFFAHFTYRCWARWNDVDPTKVEPGQRVAADCIPYLAEKKPHVDFGDADLRRLASEVAGEESNPYLIARRAYYWIARNTIYQFAREYSTQDSIPRSVVARRAGDCGEHTLLFITLCRMNGIPARWTTGWECFEASRNNNMHDWAEFYVEPYGWLPADVDMAVTALHHAEGEISQAEAEELADWLFGRMDHFRLATNGDFGAPLVPPKVDFRSDTVDFQRGEVECDGRNLYFDKWDYDMRIEPITAERAKELASAGPPSSGDAVTTGVAAASGGSRGAAGLAPALPAGAAVPEPPALGKVPPLPPPDPALQARIDEFVKAFHLDEHTPADKNPDHEEAWGSICVVDISDLARPRLAGWQMDHFVYPASTYKMYIMGEAIRQACAGERSLDDLTTVAAKNLRADTPLKPGQAVPLAEILRLVCTYSDNTAANVAIDTVDRRRASAMLHGLGCYGSEITRKYLPRDREDEAFTSAPGTVTSARHLATFLWAVENGAIGGGRGRGLIKGFLGTNVVNGTRIRAGLPASATVYSKTGEWDTFTSEAALVEDGPVRFILCIMTAQPIDVAAPRISDFARAVHRLFWSEHDASRREAAVAAGASAPPASDRRP